MIAHKRDTQTIHNSKHTRRLHCITQDDYTTQHTERTHMTVTHNNGRLGYSKLARYKLQLLELYLAGVPVAEIANEFHCGRATIYRLLKREGVKKNDHPPSN